MSDSSDDSGNFIEIPYSKRPEWADIQPINQVCIFKFCKHILLQQFTAK